MSRADSPLKNRMVFCFGSRRSGTYLLERLLGTQPEIAVVPSETHLISHGIAPLLERFHHGVHTAPRVGVVYGERERLLDAARDFCDVAFSEFDQPEARLLLERTPLHAEHGALLGELYPDGRFVHIIRDGRDVAASLRAQRWGPGTIGEGAAEWKRAVLGGRELASQPGYVELRYEDLLATPEVELTRLFAALGLEGGDAAIAVAKAQLARPLNVGPSAAIGAGKWRQSLSSADLAAFDAEAGSLLRELDYPDADASAGIGRFELLRAATQRAGGLLGGRPKVDRSKEGPERGDPRFSDPHDTINGLLEAAASGVAEGVAGGIADLLSDDVRVRIVSPEATRDASGADALALLAETLDGDPALHGRRLREELLLSGAPTAAVSLRFELAGGGHAERIIAVTTLRGLGETVLYVAL